MKTETQKMPYSPEAEQALLGCMLLDNEVLCDVIGLISDDDFYVESHRYILTAIKQVYASHKPVDIVTVTGSLESTCTLDKAGGISYLAETVQCVPSTANYKYYYDIVRRDSTCRRLARSARDIAEYACSGHDEADTMRFAEDKIYSVSKRSDTSAASSVGEVLSDVLEKLQKLTEDKNAYRGVMTGINRLDRLTNGLQKTNLIVLAARPGIGKTSLAMNIVEHVAESGNVCAVFSLEMSKLQLTERLVASSAGVSQSKAAAGGLSIEDWRRIVAATTRLEKHEIIIDDSSLVTPAEIFSKCRRIKAKHGGRLDLIMIDYIQLMRCSDRRGVENRVQEVASITRDLKIMAKELDVPVLALSQLRRRQNGEPTEPQLSDLRESGAIEQDADIVMFINRPDMYATDAELQKNNIVKGTAYLTVAKNRHGGLDKIPLWFKSEITKFVNPEFDETIEERAERSE
ncbi:MAG: replicative DNA helicase [Clostridia bacterium]|nr:replicative DNA helicase [Clostridia bacterium]